MAGESEEAESASLERTPTWAVATVFLILITVSILIEHALHLLAKVVFYFYLQSRLLVNIYIYELYFLVHAVFGEEEEEITAPSSKQDQIR